MCVVCTTMYGMLEVFNVTDIYDDDDGDSDANDDDGGDADAVTDAYLYSSSSSPLSFSPSFP